MLIAVIVFLLIIGVLIFVHEMGHFITARRNGIRAPEFGFGFPPRILGIQVLSGKKTEKIGEKVTIERKVSDLKKEDGSETITEEFSKRVEKIEGKVPVEKWRFIWGNKDGDDENEKEDLEDAHKNQLSGSTIYSLNWIPLGGFVKIKGENGENKEDPDSFSAKSSWVRIKVLLAGVAMNFILAWVLITLGLMIGDPEPVGISQSDAKNSVIQISQIFPDSPASAMGLAVGDEILKTQLGKDGSEINITNSGDIQSLISSQQGSEMSLKIKRGDQILVLKGTPRTNPPEGQGSLGIGFQDSIFVKYPIHKAIWKGLVYTFNITATIFVMLFEILRKLLTGSQISADVAGPVGILILTKQVSAMGLIYIIHLAAILSINLGIINALPIPALDGGRVLFVLIEKIKGSPISQKVEQAFHTVGFILLLTLMALVTYKDIAKLVKW
jgi:regulator of sigma E protease